MAKQSKRFKCDHGIYHHENRGGKYVRKSKPELTVSVGGVAYYYGDGETGYDVDQVLFKVNGKDVDVTDLMKALDCMEEFNNTAQKEADLIYANECASEEEEENIFEMIANYTQV